MLHSKHINTKFYQPENKGTVYESQVSFEDFKVSSFKIHFNSYALLCYAGHSHGGGEKGHGHSHGDDDHHGNKSEKEALVDQASANGSVKPVVSDNNQDETSGVAADDSLKIIIDNPNIDIDNPKVGKFFLKYMIQL